MIPEAEWLSILEAVPIVCVDVAIWRDGRVLLVRRADAPAMGQWWLPGGRLFKNEGMRECAARKAREEVGLDCQVGPLVYTAETMFPDGPGGVAVHSVNSCFLLWPMHKDQEVVLDEHHSEHMWRRRLRGRTFDPYVEKCLKAAGLT